MSTGVLLKKAKLIGLDFLLKIKFFMRLVILLNSRH